MQCENFIASTITISILNFSEKYIDSKTVTFFIVEVYNHFSKQKWKLEKRYSEFEILYKNLAKLLPNVPIIPGKSIFKVTTYDALTKRRFHLETFLKECATRKDIMSNDCFKLFLELEKHSPEFNFNSPKQICDFSELPLGIRDFYYYVEESMMFVVCADMNIASRVDSYITNVNLPWERKTDAHVAVGAVFAYRVLTGKDSQYVFEKQWAKSFPEQTGVVSFDEESQTILVGLDSGRILSFKTTTENQFTQYDDLCHIKPHKDRVMGLAFDPSKGYIYSCSSDKRFIVNEINYQSNLYEIATSQYGYTNLAYDKRNSRIFLTNEGGVLTVFLTSSYPPNLVCVVQTHTENSIRGIDVDYRKEFLFTATNKGDISLMELGLPGKEQLIKETSYFGGNVEIRIIRYNLDNNELITGDQSGKITIWALKTGQPICIFIYM